MRRGLRFLVDPEIGPEDRARVRAYFQNRCAYCDVEIAPTDGDMDHLVAAANGGSNAISNRVLSCKTCNAHGKREQDWLAYLKAISINPRNFEMRRGRIERWIELNGGRTTLDYHVLEVLKREADRTTAEYDVACQRIREQQKAHSP